jgi:hypothetical protein
LTHRYPIAVAALVAILIGGASVFADAPSAWADTALAPERGPAGAWRSGESAVGVLFGVGWYDNDDFNADLELNGVDPIETGFEYGLQFRHRVSRWFSVGGELARMDGRTNPSDGSNSEFGIAATPLLIDVFVHPVQVKGASFALFGGIGPLIATRLSRTFPDGGVLDGVKTGLCMQGGGEGELRFGPNFGFFLRGLMRRAETKEILVDNGTGEPPLRYDVDFNGVAVTFGPRWYFGGEERPPGP